MQKLAVCEYCGNIFMMGDRVWTYRGDKFCSEDCASKAEYLGKQGKWKNTTDKKGGGNAKMKEVKLTIDGKEVQLTDEQLKMLGVKVKKNPFDRVSSNGKYYYTIANGIFGGDVSRCVDRNDITDRKLYSNINYFNDKEFAEQVYLHQLLYRKLLKFAYDNEYEDTAEWDGKNAHWAIRYNEHCNEFCSYYQDGYKALDLYFSSKEVAERSIKEVVEPFMKEHPEFKW